MGLLDGKIAKQVLKGLKKAKMTKPAVLTVMTPGTREAGREAGGMRPVGTDYPCLGLVRKWNRTMLNQTIVQNTDRVVMLLGASLKVAPAIRNTITIEGMTTRIVDIERDPAGAAYNCLTR